MNVVSKFTKQLSDSLTSFVSGLGTQRDKAATTFYVPVALTDAEAAAAYQGSWLARKIVNIPAFDSTRRWRAWQAEKNIVGLIEDEEKRLDLKRKILMARIAGRLFGGAALYISTGTADTASPLEPASIRKGGIQFVNIMLRRQLTPGDIDYDPESEFFGKPSWYEIANATQGNRRIHASRLVLFYGEIVPDTDFLGEINRGWSDSVLTSCLQAMRNADATAGNVASLVFEAKIDIIKVPNMMASIMEPDYEQRLLEKYRLASLAKGINGTMLLDGEEEYESKATSFAQLPELMDRFYQIAAGAADIPLTRLLGQSPAGMNATGESDMRNYYDRLQSDQELTIRPAMATLDECLIWSATGSRDKAIHYIWNSLWQITDKERADLGKVIADTTNVLNQSGLFPPEALAKATTDTLVEHSVYPGLESAIDDAGGHIDFEAQAEEELEQARLAAEAANMNTPPNNRRLVANDAAPRSLYLRRDVVNASELTSWAKAQGFTTVQTDLHVTIAYSKEPIDWMKVGDDWSGDEKGRVTIRPGGPRQIDRFGEAVVLLFSSSAIRWRHLEIKEAGATWDHEEFQPHITITWQAPAELDISKIEPYQGQIVLSPEIFETINDDWSSEEK